MPAKCYSVKDFGAVGDGTTLDNAAIQAAIDACGENGGGVVYFPGGSYLCGTLQLRSLVELEISAGAVLLGSKTMSDYEESPRGDFCRDITSCMHNFIHAINVHDVTVRGMGVIDGNNALREDGGRGPMTFLFENCRRVTLRDVTVARSPGWCTTFVECEDVRILGTRVQDAHCDGINIVGCRKVLYDGVIIDGARDDPLCIKNEGGPERPLYNNVTEDVIITNTIIRNSTHPAIKIGTGTAGVFRNILVSNCIFENTKSMFTIQLMRPKLRKTEQRVIENVMFSGVIARNVGNVFDITAMGVDEAAVTDLVFDNLLVSGMRGPSIIQGLGHVPIRNLTIKNSRFIHCQDTMVKWLSCSHTTGLTLQNVQIDLRAPLDRVIEIKAADGFVWDNVSIQGKAVHDSVITISESAGAEIRNCIAKNCRTYLRAESGGIEDVLFHCNDFQDMPDALVAGWDAISRQVRPMADRVYCSVPAIDKDIDPGTPLTIKASLQNQGKPGAFLPAVTEDGKALGGRWVLLGAGENRTVTFKTLPLYRSGAHCIQVGRVEETVLVREAPCAFAHIGPLELSITETEPGNTRVKIPIANVGGQGGLAEVELDVANGHLLKKDIYLEPGESSFVVFDGFKGLPSLLPLKVADYPPWLYHTYANTNARFLFHRDGRIEIQAGGERDRFDQHAVVYVPRITGDYSAVCRVLHQDSHTGEYAAVGLIARNRMTDDASGGLSKHYRVPKYGAYKIWHLDLDGDGRVDARADGGHAHLPVWFKIEKRAKTFRAFTSPDGTNWQENERHFVLEHATDTQDVGVFGSAYGLNGVLCKVIIGDFEITSL